MILYVLWGILILSVSIGNPGIPCALANTFLNLMDTLYEPDTYMASWTYTKQLDYSR
jgi:hypothetical protein